MNRQFIFILLITLVISIAASGGSSAYGQEGAAGPGDDSVLNDTSGPASGMPGRPVPEKPIPHHEPGQPSRANSYRTEVMQLNALGEMEPVQLAGLDAMAADGVDPLAGNYTMVNWDNILVSSYTSSNFGLKTFEFITPTLSTIPDSQLNIGDYRFNDIAAADLNADGQAEQIAAYLDPDKGNQIFMSIGEMPGSLGKTTSTPAAVVHDTEDIDLLVRGYDDALWHRHFDGSNWGDWNNEAGGFLLSGPAIASQGDGSFDVFVIGANNEVYRRHWTGAWGGDWHQVGVWPFSMESGVGPTPELPAPAAVARGSQIDLFRLGPDNTLRRLHFDGNSWDNTWEDLGGMLAAGPGVVSFDENHMQVFARGVDEALWHRTYTTSNGWGPWQRLELDGMPDGTVEGEDRVTIASAPSAFSPEAGEIEIYVRGSDNQLWQTQYGGANWDTWNDDLGGELVSGVAIAGDPWPFIAQAKNGALQRYLSSSDSWELWDGLVPCCMTYGMEDDETKSLVGQIKNYDVYRDDSVDIETGYFLGNGYQQLVLAYFSSSNRVNLNLYDIGGGFKPQLLTQIELNHDIDWFSITTGDFLDRDGIDEIALAYADGNQFNVEILRYSDNELVMELSGEPQTDSTLCWNDENPMIFAGTLEIVSGDFDNDGQDEIAMTTILYCEDYQENTLEHCWSYRYHSRTRIFDILKASESYKLTTYFLEPVNIREARRFARPQSVSLTLAAGDVDGDGKDEIIRSWPNRFGRSNSPCLDPRNDELYRFLQVLKLPNNKDEFTNNWDSDSNGEIDNPDSLITSFDER